MISLKNSDFIKQVPKKSGVYLFYNEAKDFPIYIGKSINLYQRIKSHFQRARTDKNSQKLIKTAKYLDWQVTSGELGALLLEASLIKEKSPLINRQLRRVKKLYSYQIFEKSGNLSLILDYQVPHNFQFHPFSYGLFRSKRKAIDMLENLIVEHKLCRKMLGLEKTSRSCFAYQLGRCLGACVNKETIDAHNQRILTHLMGYQNKVWSFKGMIGIIETSVDGTYKEIHFVKDWCYLGKMEYKDDEHLDLSQIKSVPYFDLDIYKILLSALYQPKQHDQLKIVELS